MSRLGPKNSVGGPFDRPSLERHGQASEDGPSPTRELIIRLEVQVSALTGAVRGLEERLPARVVSVEAAAEHRSVSVQTIRRWCKAGQLAYVRRGRELRIDLTKVRAVTDDDLRRSVSSSRA